VAILPNAANASVDPAKLVDYVLNGEHAVGRNKARVFRAALGVAAEDAELVRLELLAAAARQHAVLERNDVYGAHYSVEFVLEARGRSARVRSLWTIRTGEDFARFVSAFVL
jgi:hypothetical protein